MNNTILTKNLKMSTELLLAEAFDDKFDKIGGEISGNVTILSGNYVQTNNIDHTYIYSTSPTFMQVEYLEGGRNPSSGMRGYILLSVIPPNQIKLSSANGGDDLSDLTAWITENYSPLWSISLSGGMLPQYFKIESVNGQIVTLDKDLRDIYNIGGSNEYRWYRLSSESEEYFASIAGIPNNAFYCVDVLSAGNTIIPSGITHNEGAINATIQQWSHAEGCDNIAEGRYTHVEGYINKALGVAAHAEGLKTIAEGPQCHVEGRGTFAGYGYAAHAEGQETSATANYAHSEGHQTLASGKFSHAEGRSSSANGNTAHAEGYQTSALGNYSHAEGYQTQTSSQFAHSEGYRTYAEGNGAHAEGGNTYTKGNYTHTEGYSTSAICDSTLRGYQFYSTNINYETNEIILSATTFSYVSDDIVTMIVDGIEYPSCSKVLSKISVDIDGTTNWKISVDNIPFNSITEDLSKLYCPLKPITGYTLLYSSNAVHAEGYRTLASKLWSHAEGADTIATGYYSHAEGYGSNSTNYSSHSEGANTIASGQYSHTEGNSTIANGIATHAEGNATSAIGNYSHAEGSKTYVKGQFSHVEGAATSAIGGWSHAEGRYCLASEVQAHAEGFQTVASGTASHSENRETSALGNYSHAEGQYTLANGPGAHAEGQYTSAYSILPLKGYGIAITGIDASINVLSINVALSSFKYDVNDIITIIADGNEYFNCSKILSKSTVASKVCKISVDQLPIDHIDSKCQIYCGLKPEIGSSNVYSNAPSHSEGYKTVASEMYAHSEGAGTIASGKYSHTEGFASKAIGIGSHVEGFQTSANGMFSHATGIYSNANDNYSQCWNGISTDQYSSKGEGTFCINPINDISGFYIGDKSLAEIITEKVVAGQVKTTIVNALTAAGIQEDTALSDISLANVLSVIHNLQTLI